MSSELTKEQVIQNKKQAISKLNTLFENYIASDSTDLLKKTNLISYWISQYSNYIAQEKNFNPTRLLSYKRGNVIRVNFGFRIGNEFGGLHFAMVLDNDNKHNSSVITVIPLSSTDGKTVHQNNVDLGTELFQKAADIQQKKLNAAQIAIDETKKIRDILITNQNIITHESTRPESIDEVKQMLDETLRLRKNLEDRLLKLDKDVDLLNKNGKEIFKLKSGTMAIVNQITTISKQRIYVPKRSSDFLYGVSLSETALDKITNKVKELYIF